MTDEINFEPLTGRERADVEAEYLETDARDNNTPCKPPVGSEPGEGAAARLFRRSPDMFWTYRDVEGAVVFCVARWNKPGGEKTIRPLSWFDVEGWRPRHWPAPRPLYNLDKLAANPNTAVVVTEGEKAADAAALIFPESIAITSSGGANACSKTDWKPLAGRTVLIWPDHDEAGAKYAVAVAAILLDLGCALAIVETREFLHQYARARETTGYDAADALTDGGDVEALRKLAASLAKPFEAGPAYLSWGAYRIRPNGLFVEVEEGRGDEKRIVEHWVSAPFEIIGKCRDPHGVNWGKVIRWRDGDKRKHVRHVADAAMHADVGALCSALAHCGLSINPTRQRAFRDYLAMSRTRGRVTIVERTGWHEVNGFPVFVLPGEVIGPAGCERVILDAAAHGPYEAHGSVEDWRGGVARLADGHILPVLVISAALAGPLLHLANMEGGGVHFFGTSSKGKTTLLQLAASVWGRGDPRGYLRTWRATANGLEGAAAGATDTALILDEVGEVDAREMGPALYSLGNGTGKTRAQRDGSLREPKTWRVLTISSGEIPAEAKLAEERGRRTRAGQLVRMLDIPAQRACGVFDNSGPDGDAASFAKACKLAAASDYGTAGPAFVRRLISDGVTGDDVRAVMRGFVSANVPKGAGGQIDRAAHRLALIAAAGELATQFGLTGWSEGEATEAAAWALAQWIEGRGGTEPAEVTQAIATVRRFIEAHGEARFDSLDDLDARPVPNRAGWREGAGEHRRWLIPTETWKHEVCVGFDAHFVAKILAERGMLDKAGDGLQPVRRIKGQTHRVRVITPRIFDGGEA